MPHSGLQSTIQLALHFGGVNATPGFLLNGWRKLFFHFDGMARAQLMNTLSATATVLHTIHGIVAHFCCPL